jgi:putative flippase GtrA
VSIESSKIGPQFVRYLCVGCVNTLFGYGTFALALTLLNHALPLRYLYLTVVLASVLTLPINITFAFAGYKFLVFRTKGNYMREWLKAFAVYGTGMIPGLVALSALTRLLQGLLQRHPITRFPHLASSTALPGYIANAIVISVMTIYSFIAHRQITFKPSPT